MWELISVKACACSSDIQSLSLLAQVKYWLHRMRWQSCTGPGFHPQSLRRSQKANAKEVWARPKQNGMHICRKAFAVTGRGLNMIPGHVCFIRRSRLQHKKNASVGMACFFWVLEGFPAGTATGAEQARLGQLTFCVWSLLAIPGPQCVWL